MRQSAADRVPRPEIGEKGGLELVIAHAGAGVVAVVPTVVLVALLQIPGGQP